MGNYSQEKMNTLYGHVQRKEDSRRVNRHCTAFQMRKETNVDHTLYLTKHRLERHRTDGHGTGKRLTQDTGLLDKECKEQTAQCARSKVKPAVQIQ